MISHFNQAPNLKATITKAPVTSGTPPPPAFNAPKPVPDKPPAYADGLQSLASSMMPASVSSAKETTRPPVQNPAPAGAGYFRDTPNQGMFRGTPLQGTAPLVNKPATQPAPVSTPKPMAAATPTDPLMNLATTMAVPKPVSAPTVPVSGPDTSGAPVVPTSGAVPMSEQGMTAIDVVPSFPSLTTEPPSPSPESATAAVQSQPYQQFLDQYMPNPSEAPASGQTANDWMPGSGQVTGDFEANPDLDPYMSARMKYNLNEAMDAASQKYYDEQRANVEKQLTNQGNTAMSRLNSAMAARGLGGSGASLQGMAETSGATQNAIGNALAEIAGKQAQTDISRMNALGQIQKNFSNEDLQRLLGKYGTLFQGAGLSADLQNQSYQQQMQAFNELLAALQTQANMKAADYPEGNIATLLDNLLYGTGG